MTPARALLLAAIVGALAACQLPCSDTQPCPQQHTGPGLFCTEGVCCNTVGSGCIDGYCCRGLVCVSFTRFDGSQTAKWCAVPDGGIP